VTEGPHADEPSGDAAGDGSGASAGEPAQPEVLAWGQPFDLLPQPGAVGPRRRRLASTGLVIGVAAAVVLTGGGAYAGYRAYTTLSGGGPQPEKYAPASTFAFLKLDADPAASEKLAIARIARKFPGSLTSRLKNTDQLRDRLLTLAFKDSTDPHIDYNRDVKPWAGSRVGVAGFFDSHKRPQVLGIVQVKNSGKARTSLKRIARDASAVAYDVKSDYALLAENHTILDDAERQARTATLAKRTVFRDDVASLGRGQVVTGWSDLSGVGKAIGSAFPLNDLFGQFGQALGGTAAVGVDYHSAGALAAPDVKLSGRVALGVHVRDNYGELVLKTFGVKGYDVARPSVRNEVASLPDDTVGVIAVSGVDAIRKAVTDPTNHSLKSALQLFAAGPLGVRVNDLLASFGDSVMVSLGNVPDNHTDPWLALRTRPYNRATAERVVARLGETIGAPLETRTVNGDLVVSNFPEYATKLAAAGHLGNTARFHDAVGPLDGVVVAVGYVDLHRILTTVPDVPRAARSLAAVGFAMTHTGTVDTLRVRMLVG
jgi:hypothetical protein